MGGQPNCSFRDLLLLHPTIGSPCPSTHHQERASVGLAPDLSTGAGRLANVSEDPGCQRPSSINSADSGWRSSHGKTGKGLAPGGRPPRPLPCSLVSFHISCAPTNEQLGLARSEHCKPSALLSTLPEILPSWPYHDAIIPLFGALFSALAAGKQVANRCRDPITPLSFTILCP